MSTRFSDGTRVLVAQAVREHLFSMRFLAWAIAATFGSFAVLMLWATLSQGRKPLGYWETPASRASKSFPVHARSL